MNSLGDLTLDELVLRRLQPNVVSYTAAISACVSDWSRSFDLLQKLLSENLGRSKHDRLDIGGLKLFSIQICNFQHFSTIYLIHIYSCVLDVCYLYSHMF